jgi:hypothetical protein
LVAIEAGTQDGTLLTRPLLLPPGELRVNAEPGPDGWVKAEVLDTAGHSVPGYAADECRPVGTDSLDGVLRWREHDLLPACPAEGLRLRFVIRAARLYSFRVYAER